MFQRAIAMSSSINAQYDTYSPMELAKQQAKVLNCPHETSKEIYECMMQLPAQNISSSLHLLGVSMLWKHYYMFHSHFNNYLVTLEDYLIKKFQDWGIDPVLVYYPVVEPDLGDEQFLNKNVAELMLNGKFSHVPFLTGYTKDEFSWRAFSKYQNTTCFISWSGFHKIVCKHLAPAKQYCLELWCQLLI